MRIGVISDTHLTRENNLLPKRILDDFKLSDMVLHAGDLIDLSVMDKLKGVCKNVHAVWGNMDPQEVRQNLPEKDIISVGKHKIGLMHGYGPPDKLIELAKEIFKKDNVDIVVFGHAHYPVNETRDGILFFNPGSALDKIFAPYNSYGIIEVNDKVEAKIVRV